ncbi:MAG TPA: T9SS type A sorting domain-containing protein, partial [Flavobacteriales bacterium]|nr:T9SS type A sorting domain-containing protein [Flavobacteriales bacterium]
SLGGNIGFSSNLTQNNTNDYFGSNGSNLIHISLLGDPTVRMHYLLPPTDLILVNNNNVAELSWTASSDATIGYNIYRMEQGASAYVKLNVSPVTTTSYTDLTVPNGGIFTYVVKAVALKTTASGSYYNQSLGIRDSEVFTLGTDESTKERVILYPNPNKDGLIHVTEINISSIEVFDHFGREVEVIYENGIIDASSLEHGQYIVKLITNNHNILFTHIILY